MTATQQADYQAIVVNILYNPDDVAAYNAAIDYCLDCGDTELAESWKTAREAIKYALPPIMIDMLMKPLQPFEPTV